MLGGAVAFLVVMLVHLGVVKYQRRRFARGGQGSRSWQRWRSNLEGEVESVSDIGDGRYESAVSLWNVTGDESIYATSPDMHGYVQVGKIWQELLLKLSDDGASGVMKIEGKHIYRYALTRRSAASRNCFPMTCTCAFRIRCWSARAVRQKTTCSSARTIITFT